MNDSLFVFFLKLFNYSFFGHFFHFDDSTNEESNHVRRYGGNVIIDLYVTLEEVYNGNFIEVKFKKKNSSIL